MGKLADGGGPQTQQLVLPARGVSLKVAVQPPFPGGQGQAVTCQGVMIQSDGDVAVAAQPGLGRFEHGESLVRTGQIRWIDLLLQGQLLGQVSEGKQRNTIGPQLAHQLQGGAKPFRGLQG